MVDDPKIESNVKFFVKSHLSMIDAEHNAEWDRYIYDPLSPNKVGLERRGYIINDLIINDIICEFGSCIVEFGRKSPSKTALPIISGGTNVCVWTHDEKSGNKKIALDYGTVVKIGDIIQVSFDSSNPFYWDYEEYTLMKSVSEVTYSRIKNALNNIVNHMNGRCGEIIRHLFGPTNLMKSPLSYEILTNDGDLTYFNDKLHESQKAAIRFCLEQRNFAIIHGPPGTGKTTVLVEIILQLVNIGNKILVCAPSNIAIDIIVEKLDAIKSRVLRLGKPARMLESCKPSSLDAAMYNSHEATILKNVRQELEKCQRELETSGCGSKAIIRHKINDLKKEYYRRQHSTLQNLLRNASVVLATLTCASDDGDLKHLSYEHFNVVIIDECSQAIEAACWIAIPRAPKLIVAGDHLQLPPTVKSNYAQRCGLRVSLMERAIKFLGQQCYMLLTHQYRMNSSIMQWVSLFYEDDLVADDTVAKRLLKDIPNVMETDLTEIPLLIVDTAGFDQVEGDISGSKYNECEANIVALIVKHLTEAGVHQSNVAVISPYTSQVSCILTKISNYRDVEVRTVDGFQGREKEAVIISLVRSNKAKELGFVSCSRRLNVAVSRAQCFVAVIGDSSTVATDATITSLWRHVQDNGGLHSAHELSHEIAELNLPAFTPSNQKPKKAQPKSQNEDKDSKTKDKGTKPVVKKTGKSPEPLPQTNSSMETIQEVFGNIQISSSRKDQKYKSCDEQVVSKKCKGMSSSRKQTDRKSITLDIATSSTSQLCAVLNYSDSPGTEDSSSDSESEPETCYLSKRKKQLRKNIIKTKEPDTPRDLEADLRAIEEARRRNTTCFLKSCRADVRLFAQLCQYCKEVFCITHFLPEVHGCGEAAKRAARRKFRQSQNYGKKDKKAASQKLKQKLSQLAEDRKKQSKK